MPSNLGLPALSDEVLRGFIGPPLQDQFALLGLDAESIDRAIALYRERYLTLGMYENAVYAGIREALASLAESAYGLAVATSKLEPVALAILTHFELDAHFGLVAGSSLDGGRRQKADIIEYALNALGADPTEVVMVGDRAQDVLGAKACAVRSIGVRWGYATVDELEQAGADLIIDTPAELVPALDALRAAARL